MENAPLKDPDAVVRLFRKEEMPDAVKPILEELKVRRLNRRGGTEVICIKAAEVIEWLLADRDAREKKLQELYDQHNFT